MKTAVITTGGLGTRIATITKSCPKTMLPVYAKSEYDNDYLLKPIIEIIFENLYDYGFRKFCIIVSSNYKSVIKNHLTHDLSFIKLLSKRNHYHDKRFGKTLSRLSKKIEKCEVHWINQDTPMGFGHALLSAKKFVKNDAFLLHAGDAYFPDYTFLPKLTDLFQKNPDVACGLLLESKKLLEGYGIAEVSKKNSENIVIGVEEKPKKPKSNLVILPMYIFKSNIFDALQETSNGYNKELQVTDAIGVLINKNEKVVALKMKQKWFDIGTPQRYFNALNYSYKYKH
tara:strand:- start:1325 stop:2179 length:855 start_codon:yes stop_codon:yes gene_type:complete